MNSLCRTCMQKHKNLINILEYKEKGKELSDILLECTAIRVQKSDAFPLCICRDCLEKLLASWDFRGMVIKTDMKLQNIVKRNDKENILQISNKCIEMTIDKEEITAVKSEIYNLSAKENVDTSSSNYTLCRCVTRQDTDEQWELNSNVNMESCANSNIIQSIKEHSEGKDKSAILTSLIRKSVSVIEKKGSEMLLEDSNQNNLDKIYTSTSTSENNVFLEISNEKEDKNITINNKKLSESKDNGNTVLLANTEKQNIYSNEEECLTTGDSQDSDSNGNKFNNLGIQDIKTEQQKDEVEDFHDENNLSESDWDFRGMVIKTDMKLQNIVKRNDKENILQISNKCIEMTIDKEEITAVKSEIYNLSAKENVDTSSSNYTLCRCVTRQDTDEQWELNSNVNTVLLANTEKQNIYSNEEKCLTTGDSQDSDSNGNKFNNLDIQDIKTEQQKDEVEDFHDENNLSESENEELDGILLTDNSQSYLDKIIDTLDSEDNNLKYLKLLAQSRNKKFTRKERRKMFVFCKICRKAFNYRNYTERHVFLHKSDRLMKCDICNKGFITKRELHSHKVVHSEDRSFTCKTCGKTFKKLNYLTKHETTHLDTEPLKCNLCDRTYKRKELLKIHLQTHKSDTDYLCELCGKVFSSLTGLYGHKYVHVDQRKYSCSICGKTFSRALHRRQHMRKHSEERPYTCSYCDKCFKSKKVLVKHSLTHSDEKPYSCRICYKLFKHSASLYNHMRVHTGETPYPCKLCPSRFKYSHHLKNHMKSHN